MGYKSDIEIAQECTMQPITAIAEKAGIDDKYLEQYGKYKAKIDYNLLKETNAEDGKLILVTAINPTPAGEGKTTTSVGLVDGLSRIGKKAMVALREPSLGPVFGVKGGAAGGGYAQVVPMEDINLHFTGDFHAIGAANNLLAAMIDNHIFQGNALNIDPRKITGSITQRNAAHDVDIYIQVSKEIPCTLFQHSDQQIHAVVVVAAAGTARCWKIGFGCKGLNFAQNRTAALHGTGHTVAGNAKRTAFQQHL